MASLGALLIFVYLVYLAHSTLLYFLVEERLGQPIPFRELIIPWPEKRKATPALAFVVALIFLALAVWCFPGTVKEKAQVREYYAGAMAFAAFPLSLYAIYIVRRSTKRAFDGKWEFVATQASAGELAAPIAIAAVINSIYRLLH